MDRRKSIIVIALVLTTAACEREPHTSANATAAAEVEQPATATPAPSGSPATDEALLEAARLYVAANSVGAEEVAITVVKLEGDYARLRVTPVGAEGDPATVFMKRTNGEWEPLSLGTGFAPDDLRQLTVPETLWRE